MNVKVGIGRRYYYIAPKLIYIGLSWERSRGYFFPILTSLDCFSRLTLWD